MANVGFLRYFTEDPGDDVLLQIEGVSIIDTPPAAANKAVGTGVVCLVAELEDGPFNTPTEAVSGDDFVRNWGGFGYTYNGVPANNPCARKRLADNTLTPEYWNGNGAVAVSGKKFARLIVTRVDTRVGNVRFTRCASITGTAKFTYALQSGQVIDTVAAGAVTTTFTGVVATLTSVAATYAMNNGDWVKLSYDDGPVFQVTFLTGDTTRAAVMARINQYAGYAMAEAAGGGQNTYKGRIAGLAGKLKVDSASAPGVLTALGIAAGTTAGTGNVNDISKVTFAELKTLVEAADPNLFVEQLEDGRPRIVNEGVPATGTLQVAITTTALDFGFPMGVTSDAASGNAGTIPAGTRVNDGTRYYVTMQSIAVTAQAQPGVTASGAGPYSTPIRHATDDGTGTVSNAGTIVNLGKPIIIDAFIVTNVAATTAALTEAQIDNAYETALQNTININSVAKLINIIVSARQSNYVRQALKLNAIEATKAGLAGRITCTRPPLGTLAAAAESATVEPGAGSVGGTDRVIYNFPGTRVRIRDMAQVGITGGAGFTADGVIDVGSDTWCAAFMSVIKPEENPGQDPTELAEWMSNALSLESGAEAQNLQMQDYILMKAAGICGARHDGNTLFFQSGIVVNGTNIARRRMADYLQDTIAAISAPFVKKLAKRARRDALKAEIIAFFESLLGRTNENQRRIAGYTVDDTVTTPQQLQRGLYRLLCNARTLPSMDNIALMSTVGESVSVVVLAPGETQPSQ